MPTLNWIGKDKVVNHHQNVPFRVLDYCYAHGEENSGNMIIHGDNLDALKALLPKYEGRIKCAYIDPPYNTGNENWVYNDNVNDPKIKKWLGEVVGREGEDLSRHDKWLCMMYPRLKLLQQLMSRDGIIAVSIDDNEVFNLGMLMNEIFGATNRLACAPWLAEPSGGREKTKIRNGHEYILIYTNGSIESLSKDERSEGKLNLKDALGKYRKGRELRKWGGTSLRTDRPNQWFGIATPSGEIVYPYRNDGKEGHWRWSTKNSEMQKILTDPSYAHWELCSYDSGVVVNGETERWVPFEKIRDEKRAVGWTSWLDKMGFNADATSVLKQMFGEKPFDTPKPVSLLEWLVSLYDSNEDDLIVIDSFAGSGTTAHAVLNLNSQDNGNRRFILVEMEDYAETITAERVRRVIDGYSDKPGSGGGFNYYELGEPLLLPNGDLNENIPDEKIYEYVWFTETKTAYTPHEHYHLGNLSGTAYFFFYERERITVLDTNFLREWLRPEILKTTVSHYVIYADTCAIDDTDLQRFNITFKKIPRDISKL